MNTQIFSLAEIRNFLKIDILDEDSLLEKIATAAVEYFESYTGNLLIQRETTEICDIQNEVCLLKFQPIAKLISVEVMYRGNSKKRLLEKDRYLIRNEYSIHIHSTLHTANIVYVAGIARSPDSLPSSIKMIILEIIGYLYENRGESIHSISHFLQKLNYYRYINI